MQSRHVEDIYSKILPDGTSSTNPVERNRGFCEFQLRQRGTVKLKCPFPTFVTCQTTLFYAKLRCSSLTEAAQRETLKFALGRERTVCF